MIGLESLPRIVLPSPVPALVQRFQRIDEDNYPPPDPEDDPGPDSGSDGPIVYPTLPPTGPEGPG